MSKIKKHKKIINDCDNEEIKVLNIERCKIDKEIENLIDARNKIDREIERITKEKDKQENISKQDIIELFRTNIKNKVYKKSKEENDGNEGYWLEKMMKLKPNSNNAPDIGGYEMKKQSNKISFGDWSGEYLFSQKRNLIDIINDEKIIMTKEEFIKYFGNKTEDKKDRYSWSGSCIPKYGKWNKCGQMLTIDESKNILAMYSYDNDTRKTKNTDKWKDKEICIAIWSSEKMKKHVEDKFNQNGFFIIFYINKFIQELDKMFFNIIYHINCFI